MDIWQRGTSIAVTSTSTSFYGADRWQIFSASTGRTVSRQVTGDTTNLPNIQYCQRLARDSGNANTAALLPAYSMESADAIRLAGQSVTLSFYARRGANYSATSNALGVVLRTGTGTDQNLNAGYTGSSDYFNSSVTLTTTWQRFTLTPGAAMAGTVTEAGTAGAADYVEITGVQVEIASTATPFSRNAGTMQGELAACQRYYYLHASGNSKMVGNGAYYSAAEVDSMIQFPVTMRTTPTIDQTTGTDYYSFYRNGGSDGFNSFTISYASTTGTNLFNASQVSGTAGQAGQIATNNASAYLAFTAEL
jgi:hypothetical protein